MSLYLKNERIILFQIDSFIKNAEDFFLVNFIIIIN